MRTPLTLNPILNQDVTVARILRLVFEPLAILDDELRVTGHLAELDFASDFTSVMLRIREDAIWSDGMPVTSDDLIFTVETLQAINQPVIYRENVQNIESMIRVDARTVQIIFSQASVTAGYALLFPIIPEHIYRGELNLQSFRNMNPIGNGIFLFENLTPLRSINLTRSLTTFRRRALIEEIEVIFLSNAETDLYAFDRSRIDVLRLPFTEWTRHQSTNTPNYEIFSAMYFEFIGFNPRLPTFRDIHLRQGIAHAFNIEEAVNAVYMSHAVASVSPIHPYSWAASDIPAPVFDPARATALLGNLRRHAPLVILVNEDNPMRVSIAQRLSESLTAIGLASNAVIVPPDEYFRRIENYDYDLFIGGMNLPFAPDISFLRGISAQDPVLENAFANLKLASTESAYLQAVYQFQQTFAEHLPVIGLAFRHSTVLSNSRLARGLNPAPCSIFSGLNEWVLKYQ